MLYSMFYQFSNEEYPTSMEFAREQDMKNHYNVSVAEEDYLFCEFYYCDREYHPDWAD